MTALVLTIALALAAPSVALAQTPAGDSVTGSAGAGIGRGYTVYTLDARSGPVGESPTGTVTLDGLFGSTGPLPVTCLSVYGKRAAMLARAPSGATIAGFEISVEDNGPAGDRIGRQALTTWPSDCPPASDFLEPTVSGDITVSDAPPPPTRYSQCQQGGWAGYGFNSHADCIGYVHLQARRKCIFERAAHAIAAFRAKYGLPPDQHHAMRHCVRLYTGF